MKTINDLFLEILGATLFALMVLLLTKFGFFGWLRDVATASLPAPNPPSDPSRPSEPVSHPPFPQELTSPAERAEWLRVQGHAQALDDLAFLQPGDRIDDLDLKERIRGGRTTVVWKAWDQKIGAPVAVKFLRQSLVSERSLVCQFQFAAELLSKVQNTSIVGVKGVAPPWPDEGAPLTWYYILNFCEGVPLRDFVTAHPERRTDVVLALAELARDLHRAHQSGVVFRDLTPADLMVEATPPDTSELVIRLIDFDSVAQRCAPAAHRLPATLGFSAPEVFDTPGDVDHTADIFSLARIVAFVYNGGPLPNTYGSSAADVVKLLNCPATIKKLLGSATSPNRSERPRSMHVFGKELGEAVQLGKRPLVFETIPHERRKIYLILAHACFGTFLMMMIARPLLTLWPGVQLSDRVPVAVFHGVIGSLMWGAWITASFLLYLIVFRSRYEARPAVAALFGAVGGLIAGLWCALPSVLVTNEKPLQCLGWIPASVLKDGTAGTLARISVAVADTRMALAFPLTGLLTGIGVALCLHRGISIATEASSGGSGVLPVPTKDEAIPPAAVRKSLALLLGAWQSHAYLAIPFVFAFLVAPILDPAQNSVAGCNGLLPRLWWRSFGEGAVHYLGSLGLVTGFFYAIPLIKPTWR